MHRGDRAVGAGKTTLLRLLNRLDEPDSGRVLLEGRPLPDLDVLALRRRVALVAQAPVLLTGQVLDELRAGQPGLGADEEAPATIAESSPRSERAVRTPPAIRRIVPAQRDIS
jgi:ABC-type bacteriocin/lantibiotic exporter with double-glycine peptidase domain